MSDQKHYTEPISLNSLQRIFSRTPNILMSTTSPLDSCSRTTKIDVLPRSPAISSPGQRLILPKLGVTQLGLVESLYSDDQDQQGIIFSVQSPDFILSSSSERKPRCAVPASSSSQSEGRERSGQVVTCCICSTVMTDNYQDVLEETTDLGNSFSQIVVSVLGPDMADSLQVNSLICQTCAALVTRIDKTRTQLERDCGQLKDVHQSSQQEMEIDLLGSNGEAVLSVVSSSNNLECRVLDISQGLVAAREARTSDFCCPVLASHKILSCGSEEDTGKTIFYCTPAEWENYNAQSNSLVSLCSGCMLGAQCRVVFSPLVMEEISAELEEPQPGPFLCADCDKSYHKIHLLISHIQHCHASKDKAGDLNMNEVDLAVEEKLVTSAEEAKDQVCQRTGEEPSLEKPFQCESCDKCFSNYSNMMSHVEHYHGWSRQCNVQDCGVKLNSIASFVTHHVRHCQPDFVIPESNNERNTVLCRCPVCGKSSQGVNRHWEHTFIHDKIPRFKCPLCDRRVNKVQNLKDHIKRHLGPDSKTKKCELCDKKFCPADIYKHMKMVHGKQDTKYHCNICGKTFPLLHKLKEHNKVHLRNNK